VVHLLRLLAGRGGGGRGAGGGAARGRALKDVVFAVAGRLWRLADLPAPFARRALDSLLPGGGPWQVELGFGKGRFLLRRAGETPGERFLGVELAAEYFRLAARRAARRGLGNLALAHGDALFLLAAVLPRGFARAVHVYFPDPWPKTRHHKRRLFDPETVDLVLGLLAPGGRLYFATDFLEYGERVSEILAGYPGLEQRRLPAWPEGPRTNYEAKYVEQGRPILRLEAVAARAALVLHPDGEQGVVSAVVAAPGPADAGRAG
jgi:tRNA (guanine-N7-)-methyltransferase